MPVATATASAILAAKLCQQEGVKGEHPPVEKAVNASQRQDRALAADQILARRRCLACSSKNEPVKNSE
jgi:hypothetical protein